MTEDAPETTPAISATEGELCCPLCEYDLRGLEEPRCPECGYRFSWEELRSPERRLHPYLFEHHPERNAWSFGQTFLGGLRPGLFWRTLFPTQPSRPRRLQLYWMVVASIWICVVALQVARVIVAVDQQQAAAQELMITVVFPRQTPNYRAAILQPYGTAQSYAEAAHPRFPHPLFLTEVPRSPLLQVIVFGMVVWLTWPWFTLAGLMIFLTTMRRARIRPMHVMRCVVYTSDLALWAAGGMLVLIAADVAQEGFAASSLSRGSLGTVVAGSIMLLAIATYRLSAAYEHYLRFPQPGTTALLVQLMILLLLIKFAIDWNHYL